MIVPIVPPQKSNYPTPGHHSPHRPPHRCLRKINHILLIVQSRDIHGYKPENLIPIHKHVTWRSNRFLKTLPLNQYQPHNGKNKKCSFLYNLFRFISVIPYDKFLRVVLSYSNVCFNLYMSRVYIYYFYISLSLNNSAIRSNISLFSSKFLKRNCLISKSSLLSDSNINNSLILFV